MRNLLLTLLLANVLYFMWGRFVAPESDTGIALVEETDMGPPLQLADANSPIPEPAPIDPDSDAAPAIRPAELEAQVGRSCVTVGPLRESTEANEALAEFEADGLNGRVRTTQGEVFVGHWVQIKGIPNRATANTMLGTLHAGGLGEAYIVETADEGIKISLGLFGDIAGAERTELQAKSMDLPAEISPRTRAATVFYVDLGLPPGRGAGSMIERYGEEKVLLRDAATCPRAD
jgi:hypothetical protein